jgi:hypothetical protein
VVDHYFLSTAATCIEMAQVELAELISPLFWISRPLGLLPIARKNGHFVVSKVVLAYSMCITCPCLLVGLISYFQMVCKYVSHPIAGENILELFINVVVYLFTLLNVYYAVRCSAVLCSIFQELDVLLKILASQNDVEAALRQIKIFTHIVQVCHFFLNFELFKIVQFLYIHCIVLEELKRYGNYIHTYKSFAGVNFHHFGILPIQKYACVGLLIIFFHLVGNATLEPYGLRLWYHEHRHQFLRAEFGAAVSAEGPRRRDELLDDHVRFHQRKGAPRAPSLQQQVGHVALLFWKNHRAQRSNQQNLRDFHPIGAHLPQHVFPTGGVRHLKEFVQLAPVWCGV